MKFIWVYSLSVFIPIAIEQGYKISDWQWWIFVFIGNLLIFARDDQMRKNGW